MTVADTDVLIDYLQGKEPGAGAVARALERMDLAVTVIGRFELLAGEKGARDQARAVRLLAPLPVLPLGRDEVDRAAQIARELRSQGAPIGTADTLLAGIVLHHGESLLTRNRKHFERVPGLRLAPLEEA